MTADEKFCLSAEELLRFAEWATDARNHVFAAFYDVWNASVGEEMCSGTPDECVSFLHSEWRKSRGES